MSCSAVQSSRSGGNCNPPRFCPEQGSKDSHRLPSPSFVPKDVYWLMVVCAWPEALRMNKQNEGNEAEAEHLEEMISLLRNYEGARWWGLWNHIWNFRKTRCLYLDFREKNQCGLMKHICSLPESFPIVSWVCSAERLDWIPGPVAGVPLPQFQHNLNISLCCLFRKDSLGLVGRSSLEIIRSICVFSKRS